jgi:hypothetical protein
LQTTYDETVAKLGELDLKVNPDKCEVISDSDNDRVIDPNTGEELETNKESRYLGQIIDCEGNVTNYLKHSAFGKVLKVLSYAKGVSRRARVKIFHIFLRSKINHLLPLIAISNQLETTWKTTRKVIFDHVLQKATLPKEAAAVMKLSFYDIILRPMLKIIKDAQENGSIDMSNYLKNASISAFKLWSTFEENLHPDIKNKILAVINGTWIGYDVFDQAIKRPLDDRLLLGEEERAHITSTLSNIRFPCVLTYISNAKAHELESRLRNSIRATNEIQINEELTAPKNIIIAYTTCTEYLRKGISVNEYNGDTYDQLLEYYTMREMQIEGQVISTIKEQDETVNIIMEKLDKEKENILEVNKTGVINIGLVKSVLNEFRTMMASSDKNQIEDIEIILELLPRLLKQQKLGCDENKVKRKPGRPKKESNKTQPSLKQSNLDRFIEMNYFPLEVD